MNNSDISQDYINGILSQQRLRGIFDLPTQCSLMGYLNNEPSPGTHLHGWAVRWRTLLSAAAVIEEYYRGAPAEHAALDRYRICHVPQSLVIDLGTRSVDGAIQERQLLAPLHPQIRPPSPNLLINSLRDRKWPHCGGIPGQIHK